MGADIHCNAERRTEKGWETIPDLNLFDCRDYGLFGFLADVRNYSAIVPISQPRGMPVDSPTASEFDEFCIGQYTISWLSVAEILSYDFDQITEDRRCRRRTEDGWSDGAQTCEPGHGKKMTYREFLGDYFFREVERLRASGAERIVFWFSS